jgi:hypothetical protein
MKVPRAPSIVGSFSPQPELPSAGESVALDGCLLVLAAAPASPAARHGDAQNGRRPATTPDGPAGGETAVPWPRSGVPALLPHDGRSGSPVR